MVHMQSKKSTLGTLGGHQLLPGICRGFQASDWAKAMAAVDTESAHDRIVSTVLSFE